MPVVWHEEEQLHTYSTCSAEERMGEAPGGRKLLQSVLLPK